MTDQFCHCLPSWPDVKPYSLQVGYDQSLYHLLCALWYYLYDIRDGYIAYVCENDLINENTTQFLLLLRNIIISKTWCIQEDIHRSLSRMFLSLMKLFRVGLQKLLTARRLTLTITAVIVVFVFLYFEVLRSRGGYIPSLPWEGCTHNLSVWLQGHNHRETQSYLASDIIATGLGNILFQYASLYGIAKTNSRIPVVSKNIVLHEIFNPTALCSTEERPGVNWGKLVEWKASSREVRLQQIHSQVNLELIGFFQSWKYFEDAEVEIRSQFVFWSDVVDQAEGFLRSGVSEMGMEPSGVTYIGVHVRRGDMLTPRFIQHGYTVADIEYLQRAMTEMERRQRHIVYVICSDDMTWCKENIDITGRSVIHSEGHSAPLDLAILSQCNHTIMTVGTFGWWAGWLAGGDVIYYKNYPKPQSRLSRAFSKDKMDYFYPHWKGMWSTGINPSTSRSYWVNIAFLPIIQTINNSPLLQHLDNIFFHKSTDFVSDGFVMPLSLNHHDIFCHIHSHSI